MDGERLGELKCNLQSLAHHRGESPTVYERRNVKDKTRQEQFTFFVLVSIVYIFISNIYLLVVPSPLLLRDQEMCL